MKIFNSKSNKLETFVPIEEGKVSLYLCGPTVYNHAHIGNARPIVVFDVLRRVLEAQGYDVHFVSNYTDIDDRIIAKALEEVVSEKEIADRYIAQYEEVRELLHAEGIDAKPRVTEVIDEIVEFITILIDKGYAYEVDGDVYFRVGSIDTYGQISHQKLDELKVGARIEENSQKENPLDFVLWKRTDEGLKWDTPWGEGRPGWHTECVVMIYNEFDTSRIDIHGGGQDLKFPHHENESAQSEAMHHHDLANYWVHNAMLQIDGEKMSKSLGNVQWAKDYIKTFGSNVTRWILLSTHYRLGLNISDEVVKQSQNEINRIETALNQAYRKLLLINEEVEGSLNQERYNLYLGALKDDLNIENAKVVLFEDLKTLNQMLRNIDQDVDALIAMVLTLEKELDLLGIEIPRLKMSSEDIELYRNWENAKKEKDFETADALRATLIERGVL